MKATTILVSLVIGLGAGSVTVPVLGLSDSAGRVVTVDSRGPAETPGRSSADIHAPASTINGSDDQIALAEEAIDRFLVAGLPLPPVEITFHSHRDGCRGHNGVFRMVDGSGDIEICRSTLYLLLHELAHAWEAKNMNEETRRAVMEFWDVDNWNDHEQVPGARGAEKVADAIAFALDLPDRDPNPLMQRNLCSYTLVTGRPLPVSVELNCA